MKKFIFLIFAFFTILNSSAQPDTDKIIYFDSIWKETTKENHFYYRIVKNYHSTHDRYEINDYFKSGKIQMTGHSTEKDRLKEIGEFVFYHENGNKSISSNYDHGMLLGPYVQWYKDGHKKLEGEYLKNDNHAKLEGPFKMINYWNPEHRQLVANGNGYFTETENQISEEGTILNGFPNGEWKDENQKRKISYIENYKNGNLISGVATDSINKKYRYTELVTRPKPRKGIQHFYKYISKNLKIPKEAADVYGQILLNFVVEKNGAVNEFTVLRSLGKLLDEAAMQVIRDYPDWEPGTSRGIYVRFLYSIPINIAPPKK